MNDKEKTVAVIGGGTAAGLVGYRYVTGRWPWEGPKRPPEGELGVTAIDVPSSVFPNTGFTITATVENTRQSQKSGTVVFTVDGDEVASRDTSVSGESSKDVSVNHSISELGTYNVCAKVV